MGRSRNDPGRGRRSGTDAGTAAGFSRAEVARVEAALAEGSALACPRCGVPLDEREVAPRSEVSYVRDRLVLACPRCHGHVALDRPRGAR